MTALTPDLVHSVDVYAVAQTKDKAGGLTRPKTLTKSAVACLIQPAKSSRVLAHAQLGQTLTHTVYFDADPVVKVGYELHPAATARILFVFGPARDEGGQGECFAVDCEERS